MCVWWGGWGQIDSGILRTHPFLNESMQGRVDADRTKPPPDARARPLPHLRFLSSVHWSY